MDARLELLRELRPVAVEAGYYGLAARIDAALSQQVEPKCCAPTEEELQLLNSGEYRPEELWGGSAPTCPKCAEPAPAQDELIPRNQAIAEAFREGVEWQRNRPAQTEQQPVAWQCRCVCEECVDADWSECSVEQYQMALADPDMQARALFAAPIAQTAPK